MRQSSPLCRLNRLNSASSAIYEQRCDALGKERKETAARDR